MLVYLFQKSERWGKIIFTSLWYKIKSFGISAPNYYSNPSNRSDKNCKIEPGLGAKPKCQKIAEVKKYLEEKQHN